MGRICCRCGANTNEPMLSDGMCVECPVTNAPVDIEEKGKRYNKGKTRYSLVPAWPLEEIARVFTMGAEKYGTRNWENGMDWSICYECLMRHMQKFWRREHEGDLDQESGIHHLAHAATNAMMLLEYVVTHPKGDDRPPKRKIKQ